MSTRVFIVFVVTLAGASISAVVARAESPCRADVAKLCPDAAATGGGAQKCIAAHQGELSDACKKQLDAVKSRVGPLVAACRYDISLLCSDVSPGGGRIFGCLQGKQEQLSPECKDRLGKAKAR